MLSWREGPCDMKNAEEMPLGFEWLLKKKNITILPNILLLVGSTSSQNGTFCKTFKLLSFN